MSTSSPMTRDDYIHALKQQCLTDDPELLDRVIAAHGATLTQSLIVRELGKLLRERSQKAQKPPTT